MKLNNRTAILLFSRTAEAEARQKSFGAGAVGDLRIARELIRRTETVLARTGLPVVRIDESRQRGATFGERITAGMSDAFALGYDRLLVVGNDAPGLRAQHLRFAARQLANGHNVLQRNQRGGIAMLGIQLADFERLVSFSAMAWSTDQLSDQLSTELPTAIQLPRLHDINALRDLRTTWVLFRALFASLFSLLFSQVESCAQVPVRLQPAHAFATSGRAPPMV